ncbi:extended synaptotagmin-2-like, partial [Neolamprologus brichardi]|uniref:extended synaptotagmin-2-like n=1 Tax=Neolamprologus brichardi TaxID=32507 RepID=UPI0016437F04
TVKQMWPFICQFVEKLFRETIEPAVKGANPHLSTFCFTKIDMGDKPLRVNGVKVYTENVDKRQVIMDLQISFVGNTEIDVDIKKYYCRAGIKSIQVRIQDRCNMLRSVVLCLFISYKDMKNTKSVVTTLPSLQLLLFQFRAQ